MDSSENDNSREKNNGTDIAEGGKSPRLWGAFYMLLGIAGLAASLYTGYYDLYNIVPLFGTVIAGVLTCAISILIILYGYRMIRRDL